MPMVGLIHVMKKYLNSFVSDARTRLLIPITCLEQSPHFSSLMFQSFAAMTMHVAYAVWMNTVYLNLGDEATRNVRY